MFMQLCRGQHLLDSEAPAELWFPRPSETSGPMWGAWDLGLQWVLVGSVLRTGQNGILEHGRSWAGAFLSPDKCKVITNPF